MLVVGNDYKALNLVDDKILALLEVETNTVLALGATSTASPNEVLYATEPSEPYRKNLQKVRKL